MLHLARRIVRGFVPGVAGAVLALGLAAPVAAVTIDWVTVGNPGNACDVQSQGCFGAVARDYRIARTEVTNAQYAEFLNAVAATDTNALYNPSMGEQSVGGIDRFGSPGSFSYSAKTGRENVPVNFVSFWDALRFTNWLHNDQLGGAQDATTTEDGAYTITAPGVSNNSIVRNPGARIFLPSEDEWYKAAYHDALGLQAIDYFNYPAGFDAQTLCTVPGVVPNTANCNNAVRDLTAVGGYAGAASPYGTFDQGGNVWELNETILGPSARGLRGGAFDRVAATLSASVQNGLVPSSEHGNVGFRVAAVPEPGTGLLVMIGMLGIAGWRRTRAG